MKNKALLSIMIPTLLLVGCGKTNPSENKITEVKEVTALKDVNHITDLRVSFRINKDKTNYFDSFTVNYYDAENGIVYVNESTKKVNDVTNPNLYSSSVTETYYDGLYSYNLEADNVFYKQSNKTTNDYFKLGLDFTKITDFTLEETDKTRIINGVILDADINAFFNNQDLKDITDVKFNAISDKESISEFTITYSQKGYSITKNYKFTSFDKKLQLPTIFKVKK